jgi:hypothetical protein
LVAAVILWIPVRFPLEVSVALSLADEVWAAKMMYVALAVGVKLGDLIVFVVSVQVAPAQLVTTLVAVGAASTTCVKAPDVEPK